MRRILQEELDREAIGRFSLMVLDVGGVDLCDYARFSHRIMDKILLIPANNRMKMQSEEVCSASYYYEKVHEPRNQSLHDAGETVVCDVEASGLLLKQHHARCVLDVEAGGWIAPQCDFSFKI